MKIRGMFSSLFLYYLVIISTYISVNIYQINQQLQNIEMLQTIYSNADSYHQAAQLLQCEINQYHDDIDVSSNDITITGYNDTENGEGVVDVYGPITYEIEFKYDLNDGTLLKIDINY